VRLLLDTGVLGHICHPRKHAEVRAWYRRASAQHELLLSVVGDLRLAAHHEVRARREIPSHP
jgi:hypothetical protein